MTQAMMIRAYGNTSPLNATAVCVRTGSAYITGACMSIALARTNVETSNVMFDTAVFSTIDLRKIERRAQINAMHTSIASGVPTRAISEVFKVYRSLQTGRGVPAARNYTET